MASRAVILSVLAALVVGGCSDDAQPTERGGPSSSASVATPSPSGESPSDEAGGVEPAAGPRVVITNLDTEVFAYNLPEGDWDIGSEGESAILDTPDGAWFVNGISVLSAGDVALDFYANGTLEFYEQDERKPKRLADRVVGGVKGYVVQGTEAGRLLYVYGGAVGDSSLKLTIEAPRDTPEARGWVESILASAQWL